MSALVLYIYTYEEIERQKNIRMMVQNCIYIFYMYRGEMLVIDIDNTHHKRANKYI